MGDNTCIDDVCRKWSDNLSCDYSRGEGKLEAFWNLQVFTSFALGFELKCRQRYADACMFGAVDLINLGIPLLRHVGQSSRGFLYGEYH